MVSVDGSGPRRSRSHRQFCLHSAITQQPSISVIRFFRRVVQMRLDLSCEDDDNGMNKKKCKEKLTRKSFTWTQNRNRDDAVVLIVMTGYDAQFGRCGHARVLVSFFFFFFLVVTTASYGSSVYLIE